jgi:hypothetical protein
MIRTRQIGEMIAVFVDGQNTLLGSFYRTSTATGDYETYIAHDLVNLIDARYRTLATNASRGLCGFSMGGYGAMHLPLNSSEYLLGRSCTVRLLRYYRRVTDGRARSEIAREVNPSHDICRNRQASRRDFEGFCLYRVPRPTQPSAFT